MGILIQQDINRTSILHHTQFKTTFICSNTRLQTSYTISRVILDWETLSLICIPQSDVYKCLSRVHLNLNMKEASSLSNKYSYSLTLGFISVVLKWYRFWLDVLTPHVLRCVGCVWLGVLAFDLVGCSSCISVLCWWRVIDVFQEYQVLFKLELVWCVLSWWDVFDVWCYNIIIIYIYYYYILYLIIILLY